MSRRMKVAIAGLGSRGRDMYAKSALIHPDKMEIVPVNLHRSIVEFQDQRNIHLPDSVFPSFRNDGGSGCYGMEMDLQREDGYSEQCHQGTGRKRTWMAD